MKLLDGSPLNIELPMPDPVIWEDQRLPALLPLLHPNKYVIVPTYRCSKDEKGTRNHPKKKNEKVSQVQIPEIIFLGIR